MAGNDHPDLSKPVMEADTNMHPILRGSRRIWQWNQSIADHEEIL